MGADDISYARNGEVSIADRVLGKEPPDLVFIGGFVSHLEMVGEAAPLRHFFERLASFARVIMWDKPELGLSDPRGQPPTLEQGVDDLRAVMDAGGSDRAALVIADSGEVLVSGTVKDLVVGPELRPEERGTPELKGVPGEWRLYSLAGSH